jgi:hypothetical protein
MTMAIIIMNITITSTKDTTITAMIIMDTNPNPPAVIPTFGP